MKKLDFYIADSVDTVIANEPSVYISDELQEYLYYKKNIVDFDMKYFFDIDPYGDTLLDIDHVKELIKICDNIIESGLLTSFKEKNEYVDCIIQLKKMCKKAIKDNKTIVVIGD